MTDTDSLKGQRRSDPADDLGADELLHFGEFVHKLGLLVRDRGLPMPPQFVEADRYQEALASADTDRIALGTWARDTYVQHVSSSYELSLAQGKLFWSALIGAINILHGDLFMRTSLEKLGINERAGIEPQEAQPVALEDIAQSIIDGAFTDGYTSFPSDAMQAARIQFALLLDPRCADAYLIQGTRAERAGRYQEAVVAYEQAMELVVEQIGAEAFPKDDGSDGPHFLWGSPRARSYMRARAALAYLLWRKLKNLPDAIAHFRALLTLNANDNQGNRDALICCLLESGDDEALAGALARYRYRTDATGEQWENAETCWYYSHALWLFRVRSDAEDLRKATRALRRAFEENRHVPSMLLEPTGLPTLEELGGYSEGDPTQAAWYANMALLGWQQTPGALDWLADKAWQAGLLPRENQPFEPVTIFTIPLPALEGLDQVAPPGEAEDSFPSRTWERITLKSGLKIQVPLGLDEEGRKVPGVPAVAFDEGFAQAGGSRGAVSLNLSGGRGPGEAAELVLVEFFCVPDELGVSYAWPCGFTVHFPADQTGGLELWQSYRILYHPRTGRPALVDEDFGRAMGHVLGLDFYPREYDGRGNHYWLAEGSGYRAKEFGAVTKHACLPQSLIDCLQSTVAAAMPRVEIYCPKCGRLTHREGLWWCDHIWWCVACDHISSQLERSKKRSGGTTYFCPHRGPRWYN